jgi:leucyl aminopeptidase
MDIKVILTNIAGFNGGALVLPLFEGAVENGPAFSVINQSLDNYLAQLLQSGEVKAKFKEITTVFTLGKFASPRVVILGLGKKAELTLEKIRVASAELARALRQKNNEVIHFVIPEAVAPFSPAEWGQAAAEGALLGTYNFRRHLTSNSDHKEIREFNLLTDSLILQSEIEKGVIRAAVIARAVNYARDLANEPANYLNPSDLSKAAIEIAGTNNLAIRIIEKEEMLSLGMGGMLAVSQGSIQPPKFIVMQYQGRSPDGIDIALIGKGITFDSGGISLKPSDNMGEMKGDMAGGADVIAAIGAIAQLKTALNVAAIVPATENMPGGNALKPGDVITIMNGKTVEIISTDAEGRLCLADALCFARQSGARRIVDIATLTGSCHVALGDVCSGTFGNDQRFVDLIIAAGRECGECLWQLPMNEEYHEAIRSDVADMKNSGGRYGGAISAAWFLRDFADPVPWIHLDIAGTSTLDKDRGYVVKGNTGIPVRTLINLATKLAQEQ